MSSADRAAEARLDAIDGLALPEGVDASETIRPAFREGPVRGAPSNETLPAEGAGVTLVPRPDDLRYLRTLGEGGMGRVFLARQPSLNRAVAVKTATDHALHAALVAEAVITGMLEHPNIPPVHQLGEDADGNPVLVMKRIEGAPWSQVLADPNHPLRENNPLFSGSELDAHLEILIQVATALHFAHARGVVHRDLKPANVMLGSFGEVMLIDWGVAYAPDVPGIAEQRGIVGSPAYMAPEMVGSGDIDARTDVYLLGSTLHEVLTGTARHAAPSAARAIVMALDSKPYTYDASVPPALAALANQATDKDRDARPESALEFAQALRRFRQDRAASALADRARETLDALEAALGADGDLDRARIAELTTQCRFALHESLRERPTGPAADLARRLATVLLDHALRTADLPAAQATAAELASLGDLDGEREKRLAKLESDIRARAERERERDLETGRRKREALFALVAVALVPLQIYRSFFRPWSTVRPEDQHLELLMVGAFTLVPVALLLLASRTRVAMKAEGRRLVDLYGLLTIAIVFHRVLALVLEPGIAFVAAGDLVVSGVVFATGSLWLGRPFLLPTFVLFPGAALIVAFPDKSYLTNITAAITVAAVIWAQRRIAKARAETGASGVT